MKKYRQTIRTCMFTSYYKKIPFKVQKAKARISKLWQSLTLQNIFKRKICNKSNNEL